MQFKDLFKKYKSLFILFIIIILSILIYFCFIKNSSHRRKTISADTLQATQDLSIEQRIKRANELADDDTLKIDEYFKIAYDVVDTNVAMCKDYAKKSIELAEKINYTKGLGNAYHILAWASSTINDNDNAIESYLKAIEYRKQCGDKYGLAKSLNNLGFLYQRKAEYTKSTDCYLQSLKIVEDLHDTIQISKALNNLGQVYLIQVDTINNKANQYNFNKAINYFNKAFSYKQILNDSIGMGLIYSNIGLLYDKTYHPKKKNDSIFEIAIKYHKLSLNLFEKINNQKYIAACYTNLGISYAKKRDYVQALKFNNKSLKILEEIGDLPSLTSALFNIGSLNYYQNNYIEANKYYFKSIEIANKIGLYEYINGLLDGIAKSYYGLKNYQKAYIFKDSAYITYMTYLGEKFTKDQQELAAKYESDKQQQQLEILNKDFKLKEEENKRQRFIIIGIVFFAAVFLIFSVFLFRLFKQKQKANVLLAEQKDKIEKQNDHLQVLNNELEQQKEEITAQRDEIEKKSDFLEAANVEIAKKNEHILSSIRYAQRIQKAILPVEDKIANYLKDYFIIFRPKDIVSGDFYWFNYLDHKLFIAAIDCTGHGVPGAFMSMIGNTLLNQIVNERKIFDPALILENLHISIRESLKQTNSPADSNDGMDMTFCMIDLNTMKLNFAGAKRPLYYIVNDEFIEVKGDSKSIGGFQREEKRVFTNNVIDLVGDVRIFLSTDGFGDQMNEEGKKMGSKRFKEIIVESSRTTNTMQEQMDYLINEFDTHKGEEDQLDDVTLIGIMV